MQTKLVLAVLALAFLLATTGQLEKAVRYMATAAVDAQKNDVLSLAKWNRALVR